MYATIPSHTFYVVSLPVCVELLEQLTLTHCSYLPNTQPLPTCRRLACAELEQLAYGELEGSESVAFIVTVTLAMIASTRVYRFRKREWGPLVICSRAMTWKGLLCGIG